MKLRAKHVKSDCDWITEGKEYSVIDKHSDQVVVILDDEGLRMIVFLGIATYLNEYIDWEII